MKRHATVPITAFFQRKAPRQEPPLLAIERAAAAAAEAEAAVEVRDRDESMEVLSVSSTEEEDTQDENANAPNKERLLTGTRLRRDAHHVTRLLHARELGSAGGMLQLHPQMPRKRQQQQLVRWVLTQFQPTPLELQLPEHWQRQAGFLCDDVFYTSCIEFDAQGVLLAAGSSNGIIALYDFDEHFYRSINLAQRLRKAQDGAKADSSEDSGVPAEVMRPIHTIFTRQEIKRIRWNPSNEDEIACSFSNRNEIHIFNLQKFPTKPHRVLKAMSPPSSGYNDIVYMPAKATQQAPGSNATPRSSIIGGDLNGTIRMWDPKIPTRPTWSISTGTNPVNALALSPNNQYLVCGTEAGYLMTFDVLNLSIPAFGSKAVPHRKASYHLLELIKPYLTSEYASALLLSTQAGGAGIMSIRSAPSSPTQVICQLRNDWVVVVDFLHGVVVKLHTFIKESVIQRGNATQPANVALAAEHAELTASMTPRSRNSWLSCHRCAGALLFDNSILCTGISDNTHLNVIDLHQGPRRASWKQSQQQQQQRAVSDLLQSMTMTQQNSNAYRRPRLKTNAKRGVESVGRLDRFRIPMNDVVTAVSGHPNQNLVIAGGESMRLRIVDIGSS